MTDGEPRRPPAAENASRRGRVVPCLLSADLTRTRGFYLGLGFAPDVLDDGDVPTRQGFERDGSYLLFYTDPPRGTLAVPQLPGTTPHIATMTAVRQHIRIAD